MQKIVIIIWYLNENEKLREVWGHNNLKWPQNYKFIFGWAWAKSRFFCEKSCGIAKNQPILEWSTILGPQDFGASRGLKLGSKKFVSIDRGSILGPRNYRFRILYKNFQCIIKYSSRTRNDRKFLLVTLNFGRRWSKLACQQKWPLQWGCT